MSNIRSTTAKGVAVLGAGKGLGRLISFANTIVLARLLSPDDYGLMAMAMVVCGFIGFFNEIGLGSAIIQRKDISQEQLNGAFSISVIASILLYGFTYLLAPSIGDFYNNYQISEMLIVLAITFVIGAFSTVSNALISKNMQFKALAGIEFITIVLHTTITLVLALLDYKAWSLVYGFVAAQLVRAILVAFFAKWKPTNFGEFKKAVSLIKFGLTVTYSRLTWYAYSNAATFIIGKVSGEKQLGVYSMATTLAGLPTEHLTSLIRQVASPVFSKLQDDLTQLNNLLYGFTAGLALITFPILVGMAATAPELIPILLGDQWFGVVFPLQALAVMGLINSISPLLTQALTSTGNVNTTAKYTTLCSIVVPLSVLFGVMWEGINGVAIVLPLVYGALLIILLFICKKYIQLNLAMYLSTLITPISGSIVMGISVYVSNLLLVDHLNLILLFVLEVSFGVVIYFWWLIYIRSDGLGQLKNMLLEIGIAKEKLTRWPFNKVKEKS
jgi:O-antigen/teichoic acid export membrane protein